MRLLGVPEFYRVLWFFEKTLVHLGVRGSWVYQIFMVFSGFSKNLAHFGEWNSWVYQNSPDFQENLVDFSWRDGLLGDAGPIIRNVIFWSFWSVFLLLMLTKLRGWLIARGSWVPGSVCGSLWWPNSRRVGYHEFCSFWFFRSAYDDIVGHLVCPYAPDRFFFHW